MRRMNKLTVEKAICRLFPDKISYSVQIKFSGKFSPYNANVRKTANKLTFSLSREWKNVGEEIGIGLIQDLLLRILRKKSMLTTNIELYNSFVKNLHLAAKKTEKDEKLLAIFNKVNETHFNNSLETPNLRWGLASRRRLATYDYHTDTITVSNVFKEAEEELIAYLLYHEMLHKKLKFNSSNARTLHHSREFKKLEKKFPNHEQAEKRLNDLIRKKAGAGWLRHVM